MHHLDSWIKIDQLHVTRFIISQFTGLHVSNVSTSISRSLRLSVDLFHVLYFSSSMCVGVKVTISRKLLKMDVLTFETCWSVNSEIIKQVLQPASGYHTTPVEPHRNTNTHRTRAIHTWNKCTISRMLLKMDILTFETRWEVNGEIIKRVTSGWSIFIQLLSWI